MGQFCVRLLVSIVPVSASCAMPVAADCPLPTDASRLVRPLDVAVGQGFGAHMHPILGRLLPHDGLDFPAPIGTEVRAAATGRVVFAGRKGEFGLLMVIEHGAGLETRYAHLSRFWRAAGGCVAAGDVIGSVGSTGLAVGPHLHFEVRRDGAAFDPMLFWPFGP